MIEDAIIKDLLKYITGIFGKISRDIIDKAIKNNLTLKKKDVKLFYRKVIEQIFETLHVSTIAERKAVYDVIKPILNNYSRFETDTANEINKIIKAYYIKGDNQTDVIKKISSLNDKAAHYAKTLTYTAAKGLNLAERIETNLETGVKKFKYTGQTPERDFCKKHHNKIYTLDEIKKMDNGQGLEVLYFCGGYNCTHVWTPVF